MKLLCVKFFQIGKIPVCLNWNKMKLRGNRVVGNQRRTMNKRSPGGAITQQELEKAVMKAITKPSDPGKNK